jgi:ActR/RegA family two-component response regulator
MSVVTSQSYSKEEVYVPMPVDVDQSGLRGNPVEMRGQLLVIEDAEMAPSCHRALRHARLDIVSATTGVQALSAARVMRFDLLLVELRLPDMHGLDVVRTLRAEGRYTPFIMIGATTSVSTVVEAMRLGASTVLERPLDVERLMLAVSAAMQPGPVSRTDTDSREVERRQRGGSPLPGTAAPLGSVRSTAERWAELVLRAVRADSDPKTLDRWARSANVSRSVLCECCRLVRVSPHDARDFVRMLRAIVRSEPVWQPEAVMDIGDARTLKKLLRRAGLADVAGPPSVDAFVDGQQWIPRDNPGLAALATHLEDGAAAGGRSEA